MSTPATQLAPCTAVSTTPTSHTATLPVNAVAEGLLFAAAAAPATTTVLQSQNYLDQGGYMTDNGWGQQTQRRAGFAGGAVQLAWLTDHYRKPWQLRLLLKQFQRLQQPEPEACSDKQPSPCLSRTLPHCCNSVLSQPSSAVCTCCLSPSLAGFDAGGASPAGPWMDDYLLQALDSQIRPNQLQMDVWQEEVEVEEDMTPKYVNGNRVLVNSEIE